MTWVADPLAQYGLAGNSAHTVGCYGEGKLKAQNQLCQIRCWLPMDWMYCCVICNNMLPNLNSSYIEDVEYISLV